jgi:hypothetical protein
MDLHVINILDELRMIWKSRFDEGVEQPLIELGISYDPEWHTFIGYEDCDFDCFAISGITKVSVLALIKWAIDTHNSSPEYKD